MEEKSQFMLDTLELGIWNYNPISQHLNWDKNMFSLVGIDENKNVNRNEDVDGLISSQTRKSLTIELLDAVAGRKDLNITFEVNSPKHGRRFLGSRAKVLADSFGNPIQVYGVCFDRTQEIELENQVASERAKALQSGKLASLGELSAGVAHEINNPLTIISGTISILEKIKDDPEKVMAKIAVMKRSVDRISKITNSLKKFARAKESSNYRPTKLKDLVLEALTLVEGKALSSATEIQVDITSSNFVLCDEIEIEQVLVNLVNNAIDAAKSGSEAWVLVKLFDEGENVILQVFDSGSGISVENESKLFQPFFTTKPSGEGTGLGLSIVKRILDQHEATISLDRDSNHTCFNILFKRIDEVEMPQNLI